MLNPESTPCAAFPLFSIVELQVERVHCGEAGRMGSGLLVRKGDVRQGFIPSSVTDILVAFGNLTLKIGIIIWLSQEY